MPEIKITPELLAELRRKAEACDPKEWHLDHDEFFGGSPPMTFHDVQVEFTADAEHMAAADPATVLALIAEIERLRAVGKDLKKLLDMEKQTLMILTQLERGVAGE